MDLEKVTFYCFLWGFTRGAECAPSLIIQQAGVGMGSILKGALVTIKSYQIS